MSATSPLRISGLRLTARTVTWCKHCAYPNTKLNFTLSARADVGLKLMVKVHGHWKQVAATTLHARRGRNSFRVAGRWHGQLVPRRTTRIRVGLYHGRSWALVRTLTLTVNSPYTAAILDRHS